jgi:DNA-binding response OmpR family regulator
VHAHGIEILPVKVLIVEDNPTARSALEKLLTLSGFLVQTARTLREGHEKLNGQAFILLDLDLPDGNGVELLRRIRAEKRPMKVLVITGSSDRRVLDEVRTLQPEALLIKPLDFGAMLKILGLHP